jgi:large subunit ribosomal protein L32
MERRVIPAVAFLMRAANPWIGFSACLLEFVMQPVQRISKSRKRQRRSHHALKPIHYVRCLQCGSSKLPHCACDNCGYVNPKLALAVETESA